MRELGVPHFHHELVKRAVTAVIDKSAEDHSAMVGLLTHLHRVELLSLNQIELGFRKLCDKLGDIVLDTPRAPEIIESVIKLAIASDLLPSDSTAESLTTPTDEQTGEP